MQKYIASRQRGVDLHPPYPPEWLDDLIVTAVQNMLWQKYPAIGGLQPPSLAQKFAMERQTGEFVQVLDISGNHWIMITKNGCEASTLNVYDSMHGNLPTSAQRLAADLVQCQVPRACHHSAVHLICSGKVEELTVVFSAFATSLCSGQDPTATSYNQGQMRSHLLSVLLSKSIQPFPTRGPRRKIQQPRNWFLCTASVVW